MKHRTLKAESYLSEEARHALEAYTSAVAAVGNAEARLADLEHTLAGAPGNGVSPADLAKLPERIIRARREVMTANLAACEAMISFLDAREPDRHAMMAARRVALAKHIAEVDAGLAALGFPNQFDRLAIMQRHHEGLNREQQAAHADDGLAHYRYAAVEQRSAIMASLAAQAQTAASVQRAER